MVQFGHIFFLAALAPALSVVARDHRGHGFGSGAPAGNAPFGSGSPTTFATQVSAAPAAVVTQGAPQQSSPQSSDSPSSSSSNTVDASLIPPFGVTPGIKLNDGTPRCAGLNGKPIDCDCPPSSATFLSALDAAVAGGAAFPSGNSAQDQLTRLGTCIVTLQNFKGGPGSGVGCPAVSTNWVQLQSQLQSQV